MFLGSCWGCWIGEGMCLNNAKLLIIWLPTSVLRPKALQSTTVMVRGGRRCSSSGSSYKQQPQTCWDQQNTIDEINSDESHAQGHGDDTIYVNIKHRTLLLKQLTNHIKGIHQYCEVRVFLVTLYHWGVDASSCTLDKNLRPIDR